MMKCKRYVFLLSSGQLDSAPAGTRVAAETHRWMCRHCRAFAANDKALTDIVQHRKERALPADDNAPAKPGD